MEPLRQVYASEMKSKLLPWYKIRTTKTLDQMACVLADMGLASDLNHGRELAPRLEGEFLYDKHFDAGGYEGARDVVYHSLVIHRFKGRKGNEMYRVHRKKEVQILPISS